MTNQICSALIGGQYKTTLNTAKVTLITKKLRQGIRQGLSKTSESKEEHAVHKDVTKGPCTSTLVFINIISGTPSTIEALFKSLGS